MYERNTFHIRRNFEKKYVRSIWQLVSMPLPIYLLEKNIIIPKPNNNKMFNNKINLILHTNEIRKLFQRGFTAILFDKCE